MIDWSELRISIVNKFGAEWTATDKNTAVDFGENKKFEKPKDSPWCRISHVVYDAENAEIGTKFKRVTGVIVVQCFVPYDSGVAFLDAMLTQCSAIFENKSFGKVKTFVTKVKTVGETGQWFQKNAETPFEFNVFS